MRNSNRQFHWLRLVALTAAFAAVFFVASGVTLLHLDARGSDATCPICHVAHMPALQASLAGVLPVLALIAWLAPTEALPGHTESFSLLPPARAPPA